MTVPDFNRRVLAVPVDKSDPLPAYVQIAHGIRALLRDGAVAPGTGLPPERVLCERYGVSRMTLRQAMGVLQREGLIECQRGRGTFVSVRRLQKQQQALRSFTEEIRARGAVPSTKVLSFRREEPTPPAREFFSMPEEGRVYLIERLRFIDQVPMALESVQLPCSLCPDLEHCDLVHDSLYRILEEDYGLKLADCQEEISAVQPSRAQKRLLQAPSSTAILLVCRRTRTAGEVPVEFAITAYRGDLYTALVHSVRRRPSHAFSELRPAALGAELSR